MITYLLKSSLCLALLLTFYHLVLEREKMHRFNRFYLLGSVLFSFVAPLFIIYIEPTVINEMVFETAQIPDYTIVNTEEVLASEPINYYQYVIYLWVLISAILTVRFGKNLFSIVQKIRNNQHIKLESATLVLVEDVISPHTFWNYIFINKVEYFNEDLETELFTHELTHATQKHTLDVLLLEVLKVVFWFNPIFYFLKKSVQLNHEFLADENVVTSHQNVTTYQYLLLHKTAWNNDYQLASSLQYSLTKKRLVMMTKQSSRTKMLLKKLAILPLIAGSLFLFAERVEAQEKEVEEIVEEVPLKKPNLEKSELYKEYFFRNSLITITDQKTGKKVSKRYKNMTKEEKSNVKLHVPPLKAEKKTPTKSLLNKLKDGSKYALWIDGKVVKNSELSKYTNTDFSSYFVSFVYKNARSKRFPQEYQAHLSTNKHFKAENKKRLNDYLNYLKKHKKIDVIEVVEEPKEKQTSSKRGGQQSYTPTSNYIPTFLVEDDKLVQQNDTITPTSKKLATPKEVAAYNELARKHNSRPLKSRKIKVKHYKKLKQLYGKLSVEQKQIAEPFPKFPPPPPIDRVYTYNRMAHHVKKTARNRKANLAYLKDLYSKMNAKEKAKVVHPSKILGNKTSQIETIYEQTDKNSSINNLKRVTSKASVGKKEEFGGVIFETGHTPKPKTGWTTLNGEKIYYVKYKDRTEYYNRWGQEVNENGEILTPKKTGHINKSSLDSIPTKTGWEQVGRNYYAYEIYNGKKYYFDKDSGKQVKVKQPAPEDYFVTEKLRRNAKKEYYIDNKRVSAERFRKTRNATEKYHYTGYYTKGYKTFKFYASQDKEFIKKVARQNGTGLAQESSFLKKIDPNFRFENYANKVYFLNSKKTTLSNLNRIDIKTIKSASILKKDSNTAHIYIETSI